MSAAVRPPDLAAVLGGLRDFQMRTVEHVFRRLYLDDDRVDRFLLADEVGLGKTMVARGVIARAIHHLWETVPRIDVVYICSNADIARQNINRLNVTGERDLAFASRVTLLPLHLRDLDRKRINFVSFTPGTSFDLKGALGTQRERALLYHLLREPWALERTPATNVLRGAAGRDRFRSLVDETARDPLDERLADAFRHEVARRVAEARRQGLPDIRRRFEDLCERFRRDRESLPDDERDERAKVVGELRGLLARTCIHQLEPDLIVLDEFQRFKHLLDGEDETAELARHLFDYGDSHTRAKVLLVSATPYKMYTLDDEAGDDDHYRDFLRTIAFLERDPRQTERLRDQLDGFRRELRRVGEDRQPLVRLKSEIEARLRRVMVRTERLAVGDDRNGMLIEVGPPAVGLEERDVRSYLALQRVARALEHGDVLEYWKSAPYLLNFMEDYELKRALERAIARRPAAAAELSQQLVRPDGLLLDFQAIRSYGRVDPANARLHSLLENTIGRGMWKLLWLPPSLPYYTLGAPWSELPDVTKRLVFSSWRVVPRVVAGLLSYEAERRIVAAAHPEGGVGYPAEARKRRRPLLRFARSSEDGRLTGMPVLALLYPSFALAAAVDPLAIAAHSGLRLDHDEVRDSARRRLEDLLGALPEGRSDGPEDERWYWAAPLLLDRHLDSARAGDWFAQNGLASLWAGASGAGDAEQPASGEPTGGGGAPVEASGRMWAAHVSQARQLLDGRLPELGRRPADLAGVLADLALGGWAVCGLRGLGRLTGDKALRHHAVRNAAGSAAFGLLSLFNLPEATSLLRGPDARVPHWRHVLDYGVRGCLQAVLDEYFHVQREAIGKVDRDDEELASDLAGKLNRALTLRTAQLGVDEIVARPARGELGIEKHNLRARFAVRFGDEKSADGGATRADQIRSAFNSPFWPFVLATTSVGQEGLDFHQYCHAVVHWNLPSNPVDLEQREGRVHRYKGHAVRKNVARTMGLPKQAARGGDPWAEMFEYARHGRRPDDTDLVPYWLFPTAGGARIERHVPTLPLSRDRDRLEALRRSLVVYRLVFGQARQEELVEFLRSRLTADELAALSDEIRIDLSPP